MDFQDTSGSVIKGERSMSRGFVAQYSAEAALGVQGVDSLSPGALISLKEAIGAEHDGKGVKVEFVPETLSEVRITVYPVVRFGFVLPDVAWEVQERVKAEVEKYTGLLVQAVDVQIAGVVDFDRNNSAGNAEAEKDSAGNNQVLK